VEKKLQGRRPQRTNTGYFSTFIRSTKEKTTVKRIIRIKGSSSAQKTPRTERLYLTLRSLRTRFLRSSLY